MNFKKFQKFPKKAEPIYQKDAYIEVKAQNEEE